MRCFSIVSSPTDRDIIQFAIRVQGDFTSAAKELKRGDKVNVVGSFGEFVIDDEIDKNVILLAGGIGITPFISMARFAADCRLKIPITLLYSCQSQDDIPFYEELISLEKRNPNFKVAFFITSGPTDKLTKGRVYSGRIDEDVLSEVTNNSFDNFTHFICGPKNFISALQSTLIKNNVSPDHLITEAFGHGLVTEKSHKKKSSESRFVYGMTAALMIFGTVFITGIDLVRAVPKISKIDNTQTNAAAASANTTSNQATNQSSTTNSSNTSTDSSSASTTPVTQTTYTAPVTSVS
jgi:ferredoxin-NADP reductase